MMTEAEIRMGISPFDSQAWDARKEARAQREDERRSRAIVLREKRSKERVKRHTDLLRDHRLNKTAI